MTKLRIRSGRSLLIPVSILLLMALIGCGGGEEVATEPPEPVVQGSPGAANLEPEQTEVGRLEIRDGTFTDSELMLQENVPTTFEIVNNDDTPYRFRIEDLVSDQDIPASGTARFSLTTPSPKTYTGQLLGESGDSVLAEISIIVESPEGAP